ncbi:hypothetical protein P7C71_g2727, partial [Lecanoromycetidae sp. Uapishka_2]
MPPSNDILEEHPLIYTGDEYATSQDELTHQAAPFLAWHRYFLHIYETTLQEQCGYGGYLPYWNWALDWQDVAKSPILDNANGFGGDGNASLKVPFLNGYCLTEGPFSRLDMAYIGADYNPHCLSRGFPSRKKRARMGHDLGPEALEKLLNLPDYESFNLGLENGPHLALPKIIRGDFQYFTAPNDPLFFLHHAQLDRLWSMWQKSQPVDNQNQYVGKAAHNSIDLALDSDILPMGGLAADIQVSGILTTQTELLCYRY